MDILDRDIDGVEIALTIVTSTERPNSNDPEIAATATMLAIDFLR